MKTKERAVVVDFDDTIGDFIGSLCQLHNRLHGTHISDYDITDWDFDNLHITDCNGVVVKGTELRATFREYESEISAAMALLPDAKFALDTIREIGYKVIILTARKPEFKKQTVYNLVRNDVEYDGLIFDTDKAKVIKELAKQYKISLFVDDNAKNVQAVYENCKVSTVCLIDAKHNLHLDLDPEIKRVGSLIDCIRYLKKVIKEK